MRRRRTTIGGSGRNAAGFALTIAVVLVAFLVVVTVGLLALSRVETRAADTSRHLADAQRNAIAGMRVALGRLQRHAGPDQAVTARADITAAAPWRAPVKDDGNPSGINNPFRLGVWSVTNSGALSAPEWIVSGDQMETGAPDPITPTAPRLDETAVGTGALEGFFINVKLVGKGTSWPYNSTAISLADQAAHDVVVRKQFIRGAEPNSPGEQRVVGSFGYWVGDEGTKASFGLQTRWSTLNYGVYQVAQQRDRVRHLVPVDTDRNTLISGFPLAADLSKLTLTNQLPFYNVPLRSLYQGQIKRSYHGITVLSRGVLANTLPPAQGGGLRRDLSLAPDQLTGAFAGIRSYLDYANYMATDENTTDLWREYRMVPPPADPASGTTYHSIAPVLTEFAIQLGFSVAGGQLRAHVRTRVELWNPYSSAILGAPMQIVASGLPVIRVATAQPSESIDLSVALPNPLVINVSAPPSRWLPGRFFNWAGGLNPLVDIANNTVEDIIPLGVTIPGSTAQIQLTVPQPTRLQVMLRLPGGAPLAIHQPWEFQAVTTPVVYAKALTAPRLGFHVRLRDGADGSDWLSGADLRSVSVPSSRFVIHPNPPEQNTGSLVQSSGFLFSRSSSSYNNDVPLFELPRQPVLSVGQFQHVPVADRGIHHIGNKEASVDGMNRVFDRYFFSGLRTGDSLPVQERPVLPNPRLELYSPLSSPIRIDDVRAAGELSARHLLVSGAFNVNSTAKEAWEAVLGGGALRSFDYVNADSTTGMPAGVTSAQSGFPTFWRFPQSAQETFRIEGAQGLRVHYRRGGRSTTGAEVESLAAEIVSRIKLRGSREGPFRSLEDFLAPQDAFGGESLLESALRSSAFHSSSTVPRSTAALSQADIMNSLAPIANVRSDTFVIRAFGEAINPATKGTLARAWCEAVVQRVPDPVEFSGTRPSTQEAANPPGPFGRRFKIVSFRWLGPDDI